MKKLGIITIFLIHSMCLFASRDRAISPQDAISLQKLLGPPIENSKPARDDYTPVEKLTKAPVVIRKEEKEFMEISPGDRWTMIKLLVFLNEEGKIDDTIILEARFTVLAEEAISKVKESRFEAGILRARPVRCYFELPIHMNVDKYLRDQNKAVEDNAGQAPL